MLDVVVPRKLGAPANPELGIGAVAPDGTTVLDERLVTALRVRTSTSPPRSHARSRRSARRDSRSTAPAVRRSMSSGKDVIVVDDGVATGGTAEVALRSLKAQGARSVVLAVPVAPRESLERLGSSGRRGRVLGTPEPFSAVGQWYGSFPQVSDEEVLEALRNG